MNHSKSKSIRYIAFDVDGTLVEHPEGLVVWQILNRHFVGNEHLNAERYRSFSRGELSYAEWVRLDIQGWTAAGATRSQIVSVVRAQLQPVSGAMAVLKELRRRGYRLGVVSGTIDIVLEILFPSHPFEHVFTNVVEFDSSGQISGWVATPYDMDGKAEALRSLSAMLHIDMHQFAFVGDNINDCAAMDLVGCPIAYDSKHENVTKRALHVLDKGQLQRLLDLFP